MGKFMRFSVHYDSPLGGMTMVSDGTALIGLGFGLMEGEPAPELGLFADTAHWLDLYFGGSVPNLTPPLSPEGTPFRRKVWDILLRIPYGKTMTYGEIAAEIARAEGLPRMSAQAVGGAVGHNPIAIIIPCHRVIGADGSLTGYASGLDKKRYLLTLEGINFH